MKLGTPAGGGSDDLSAQRASNPLSLAISADKLERREIKKPPVGGSCGAVVQRPGIKN